MFCNFFFRNQIVFRQSVKMDHLGQDVCVLVFLSIREWKQLNIFSILSKKHYYIWRCYFIKKLIANDIYFENAREKQISYLRTLYHWQFDQQKKEDFLKIISLYYLSNTIDIHKHIRRSFVAVLKYGIPLCRKELEYRLEGIYHINEISKNDYVLGEQYYNARYLTHMIKYYNPSSPIIKKALDYILNEIPFEKKKILFGNEIDY